MVCNLRQCYRTYPEWDIYLDSPPQRSNTFRRVERNTGAPPVGNRRRLIQALRPHGSRVCPGMPYRQPGFSGETVRPSHSRRSLKERVE